MLAIALVFFFRAEWGRDAKAKFRKVIFFLHEIQERGEFELQFQPFIEFCR